jgi:phospholipase C
MRSLRTLFIGIVALLAASVLAGAPAIAMQRQKLPASTTVLAPVKVLTIMDENHTFAQMKSGMPYLWSQAQKYGYATNWSAITHPSLPNYLAIASGSTFGISDDYPPSVHNLAGSTVFDQALAAGKTAKVYAESMPSNCNQTNASPYAVRHNPWAYFTVMRTACGQYDASTSTLLVDAKNNVLPNAGMVIPNLNDDAHNGTLAGADSWLKQRIPTILASSDFTSGRLAVVITADEGDGTSNTVLTVVLDANLSAKIVTTGLSHYSLTEFYAQTIGVTPLLAGKNAPDMRAAFGL